MPKGIEGLGDIIFIFSKEGDVYHIIYDKQKDQDEGCSRFVGAIYKMMKEYPELVEEILQAVLSASEELSKPFKDILNERPSKDQA